MYHSAFEMAAVGTGIVNSENTLIKVNPILVQMLGYSAEELTVYPIIYIFVPHFVRTWKKLSKHYSKKIRIFSNL